MQKPHQIFLTEFLYHALIRDAVKAKNPLGPVTLMYDFQDWIASGKETTVFFGADRPPRNDFIYHVHLAPLGNEVAMEKWKHDYEAYNDQVSNACLIYSQSEIGNKYLLIAKLNDPDGHNVWKRNDEWTPQRKKFASWGKDFYKNGAASTHAISYSKVEKDIELLQKIIQKSE